MNYSTGKLLFIFLVAAVLSFVGAWWLARRYRIAMKRLMSAPVGAGIDLRSDVNAASTPHPPGLSALPPPNAVTAGDNKRAGLRLALMLIALSALMSLTSAGLFLAVVMGGDAFSIKRLLVLALAHMWPVIPALGLLWRWSRLRMAGALALWFAFCFLVLLWRSIEPQPGALLIFLASEIGAPMIVVAAICMGNATRAIAPWLLPPFIGLVWASIAGIDLLGTLVERRSPLLMSLPEWLGAETVMLLFAIAPWMLAWWPLRRLGRALARAYARKQLSELIVLFTAVWTISLSLSALGAASDLGLGGVVMLVPLVWIPIFMSISRRSGAKYDEKRERPPTLLVLRVFQRDAEVRALFDDVIERWRLTGNTVLIAGTDLVERTLDADDIFTFIDRRLASRFIRRRADVSARLAEFDMTRDAEGRYRINECYCHDTTWQDALAALVRISDVVLMDLRGFAAHNAGCRYELNVLAKAPGNSRVVVLTDSKTDRAAAEAETIGAPAAPPTDRFVWLDSTRIDPRKRREVLESLFTARA